MTATKASSNMYVLRPEGIGEDREDRDDREERSRWAPAQPIATTGPEWPKDIVPELDPWIERRAEELQVPHAMLGMAALVGVSATVRRRLRIKMRDGWYEPFNVYAMSIAEPGENKTAALSSVMSPLEEIEGQERADLKEKVADWKREYAMAKARQEQWLKRCATPRKGDTLADNEREYRNACMTVAFLETVQVHLPNFFVDDATPEAINMKWATQDGVLAGLASEGALLENVLGRYSRGESNLNGLLKGWDGAESIRVDRAGRLTQDGDGITIQRPYMSLALLVQPRMLKTMGNSEDAVDKGFVPRFIYVLPASRVGYRKANVMVDWSGVLTWRAACHRINDALTYIPVSGPAAELELTLSAVTVFNEAWVNWERERRPEGRHAAVVAWSSKLGSQVIRVAGMACLLRSVVRGGEYSWTVTEEDMKRGVAFGEWAFEHARAAFNMIGIHTNAESGLLQTLLRHLIIAVDEVDGRAVTQPHPVLAKTLHDGPGGPFRKKGGSELVARLVLEAEKLGWVIVAGRDDLTLKNRSYTVNPRVGELRSTCNMT